MIILYNRPVWIYDCVCLESSLKRITATAFIKWMHIRTKRITTTYRGIITVIIPYVEISRLFEIRSVYMIVSMCTLNARITSNKPTIPYPIIKCIKAFNTNFFKVNWTSSTITRLGTWFREYVWSRHFLLFNLYNLLLFSSFHR